jgi:hypothetical protein
MAGNGSFFWSDLRGFSGFSLPRILSFVREWQSVVFLYWLPHAPNCHPLPPFYLYWQQYRAVAGSVSCFLILSKLLRLLRYEILSKLGEILRIVVCDLWSMVDGRWSMVDGRWSMVDGRWSMVDGLWGLLRVPALPLRTHCQGLPRIPRRTRTDRPSTQRPTKPDRISPRPGKPGTPVQLSKDCRTSKQQRGGVGASQSGEAGPHHPSPPTAPTATTTPARKAQ